MISFFLNLFHDPFIISHYASLLPFVPSRRPFGLHDCLPLCFSASCSLPFSLSFFRSCLLPSLPLCLPSLHDFSSQRISRSISPSQLFPSLFLLPFNCYHAVSTSIPHSYPVTFFSFLHPNTAMFFFISLPLTLFFHLYTSQLLNSVPIHGCYLEAITLL